MNDFLDVINQQFAINERVNIKKNQRCNSDNLYYLDIKNKYCSAQIQLQGAHLTDWTPHKSEAIIWLSPVAAFSAQKSIRGGIPVCWPWFGGHHSEPKFPSHGFARTVMWEIESVEELDSGEIKIMMRLPQINIPASYWPFNTSLKCIFIIGESLKIELQTINNNVDNIVIGEALHSYFNVSDVNNIFIHGLDGCDYLDKLENFKCKKQTGDIEVNTELDRIYTATTMDCFINDSGFKRRIKITKKSSLSTIVWNPWFDTANKMADLGEAGYTRMICVESGNAADNVVTLGPNQKHSLIVEYSVSDIE